MLIFAFSLLTNLLADCGPGSECVHGVCGTSDGSFVCLCKRGWTGTACNVVAPNFKMLSSSDPVIIQAISFACLINGTECENQTKGTCLYHNGVYSCRKTCPEGFVIYDGECVSKKCYSYDAILPNAHQTSAPCNGNGKCVLKDLATLGHATETDYMCSCFPIYRGEFCGNCNLENAIELKSDTAAKCIPRSCRDNNEIICSGKGTCSLDFGYNLTHYNYQCICETGYIRVGRSCIASNCVVYIAGSPVTCGGFGECKESSTSPGSFSCICYEGAVNVGNGCTYQACTESENANTICGNVGICARDDTGYKCDCKGLATGSLCNNCIAKYATSIDGKCVPNECLSDTQEICAGNGKCIKSSNTYHCQCPNMTISFNNRCVPVNCIDQELNLICSNHGNCNAADPKNMKCICDKDYTYVAPGRCIPTKLLGTDQKVCNDKGYIVISPNNIVSNVPTLICKCSPIYIGENCSDCNSIGPAAPAKQIGQECIPKSVIVEHAQAYAKEPATQVCDKNTEYVIYGDSTRPYMTCRIKDINEKKVIAYNATYLVDSACMHISQVDRTRRFYCGFAEGLTDGIETNGPTCNTNTDVIPSFSICSCPNNFRLIEFTYGKNKGKHTCIHDQCHDGSATYSQSNYCGGVGDCIKRADEEVYTCDCGQGALWDETIRECVAETCKINEIIYGPSEREYCTEVNIASSIDNVCIPDDSGRWGCRCIGRYVTYGNTCASYASYATEKDDRARGPCGGPGAGYVNDRNKCECYPGFLSIDGKCYNKGCLAIGVVGSYNMSHVCSGIGVCAYNPVTGFYGCECPKDTESYGAYCTHTGCVGQVFSEGGLKYVQCGVHTRSIQCKKSNTDDTYSCICYAPYKKVGNLCVHHRCLNGTTYCSGDVLASCELSGSIYQCQCSEGYLKGTAPNECIPARCTYKRYKDDQAMECGGMGQCEGEKLINKQCKCTDEAELVPMLDISGELRKTCISKKCISMVEGKTVVCGDHGQCEGSACICDESFSPIGNICISNRCIVRLADGTDSVCGGNTIGMCKKDQNEEYYSCKCATPEKDNFREVDGYCIPNECVFNVRQNEKEVDTMCGGANLGFCVIDPVGIASRCSCLKQYNITALSNGKCISTMCVSSTGTENLECGGNGRCAYTDDHRYECDCNPGYKTIRIGYNVYLCISENCLTGESVCSDHGDCVRTGCRCNEGYTGSQCESCADGYKENSSICYMDECPKDGCGLTEAGSCVFTGRKYECRCNDGFILDSETKSCRRPSCIYVDPFDEKPKVCYNMGTCAKTGDIEKCVCNKGTVAIGDNICVFENCITNSDPFEICENRGVCEKSPESDTGICVCDTSIYRTDRKTGRCFPLNCFYLQEDGLTDVCNGGGKCSVVGVSGICICDSDWITIDGMCYPASCVSEGIVCSGFGKCIISNNGNHRCFCDQGYELGEDAGKCVAHSVRAKQTMSEISIIVVVVVILVILAVAIFLIWRFIIKARSNARRWRNDDLNQMLITATDGDSPPLSPRAREHANIR